MMPYLMLKIKNCIVWDKKSIGLGQSHYRHNMNLYFIVGNNGMEIKKSDVWNMTRGELLNMFILLKNQ
jgi:hypothetical protein